jgi:anti-sigma regulatory factor (Ser/Thr protein kinase)
VAQDLLTLKVPNDLREIPRVAAELEAFCARHAIPSRMVHRFNLALEEVLTNIIAHAFPTAGGHEIDVRIAHRDGSLQATVSDDGVPFDPLSQPAPDLHVPLEQRRIGGLGIHLLRTLAASAHYRRDDNRNVLSFSLRLGNPGNLGKP